MTRCAFVTGGTGFLGRHLVEQLVGAGWRVVALHRPSSELRHLKALGVELAEGSITEPERLRQAMPEGCDAVFHLAANTSFWSGDRAVQTRDNVEGTRHLVEAALERSARRFILTSSESAWGAAGIEPFDETKPQKGFDSAVNYERTKHLAELEVEAGIARGLDAVILCPGHIIGKYDATQWARLIPLVVHGKLPGIPPGGGTWAAATEVARAHLSAFEKGRRGERYLLGGDWASNQDYVELIGELTGKKVPAKPMPPWVMRAMGRVSFWGSLLTRRAPLVTPELAEVSGRPPIRFRSDKAIAELDYRVIGLPELVRASHAWLKSEGLLERL